MSPLSNLYANKTANQSDSVRKRGRRRGASDRIGRVFGVILLIGFVSVQLIKGANSAKEPRRRCKSISVLPVLVPPPPFECFTTINLSSTLCTHFNGFSTEMTTICLNVMWPNIKWEQWGFCIISYAVSQLPGMYLDVGAIGQKEKIVFSLSAHKKQPEKD